MIDEQTEDITKKIILHDYFCKNVPVWLRYLMARSPFLVKRLAYEVNHIDNDYSKLIISRKTLFTGKFKLIAKSF